MAWLIGLSFAACGEPKAHIDPGSSPDSAPSDPGRHDAAMPDAVARDAAAPDSMVDAATPDARPIDAATPDASGNGAHFLTLTASGDDALDGAATIEARALTFAWTLSGATEVSVDEPVVPTTACASVPATGWAQEASNLTSGYSISTIDATDRCFRLRAIGSPDDVRVVALDVLPGISATALPHTLPSTGGTVLLQGTVVGAVTLRVTARFTDATNAVLGMQVRCDSTDASHPFTSSNLPTGSVACQTVFTAADFPAMTARVKMVIEAVDAEGDQRVESTSISLQ